LDPHFELHRAIVQSVRLLPLTPQSTPRKERLLLIAGLAVMAAVAWIYTGRLAWQMGHMDRAPDMFMPHAGPWSLAEFWLLFVMWAVMMVAMMLPSAAPLIMMFAASSRGPRANGLAVAATSLFVYGYLLVWLAFSAGATAVQWAFHQTALLSPMMVSRTPILGGVLLIAAGLFQWTPWKRSCLRHCRSPLSFILGHWKPGNLGALRMGIEHGAYCTGCCWALMALLFVAGVMNLLWIAAIAAFVLVEKTVPQGEWIGRAAGVVLVAWGLYVLIAAV
jgi:predicted metal-binding membrane protein